MPFQPPTRPHSANPLAALPAAPTFSRAASPTRETDWEDAWDSSSDKEDHDEPGTGNGAPSRRRTGDDRISSSTSSGVAASTSWSSGFQHVEPPDSSSPPVIVRPILSSAKTCTEGASLPAPGLVMAAKAPGAKLPPGGAWELVDGAEAEPVVAIPVEKVGAEAVREDVEDVLRADPLQLLSSLSISAPPTPTSVLPPSNFPFLAPTSASGSSSSRQTLNPDRNGSSTQTLKAPPRKELDRKRSVRTERRRERFAKALKGRAEDGGGVDLAELRRLAWSGTPSEVRPIVWQLLLNYLPLPTQPRLTTLSRKRKEYSQLVDQYFARGIAGLDQQIWHQIEIDVPRTRPGAPLWSCLTAQRSLERILYVWAIRHPASGYVQGINDLVCPFFQVFLSAYIDTDPELFDVTHLPPSVLSAIEADTFWCLSKLLDGIQDNYISQQPGIQRLVKRMSELVKRIDAPLSAHFEDQGVEFLQFAFRWMNCLLMREMSVKCTIRMWDTYLAEGTDAFSQFHLYVCSALLVKYSERLREMDFQEMIIFLQRLPTDLWTDHDVELLLSEAYVLKTVWQGAENHFANLAQSNGGNFGMLGR
ncbi:rab-GTPase-TBC domain-containing protein [Dioszegia hungarica]|uniref:Rab-GTPase-TBC domain-containing protein n=1 Tax=Dioszegia hungarica TaxID=4972 RepID=A0AA38LSF0_9TREE|nr:rab-GTPase-TBC domain-containing protein [Dioszegia hungarica]KAI9635757.1 rab-GTPase-TBC domain-containing protein [Dioszegia hungarica]